MISRTGLHHIRAMAALATLPPGAYAGAATLAGTIDAPPNYLGKLLQSLAQQGLLESRKGAGGGFRLSRPPQRISLFDILDSVQATTRWSECLLGLPECSEEAPCAVHATWGPLRGQYLRLLHETTLADIARAGGASPPPQGGA